MYPALVDIAGKPDEKPTELVEGALDLAVALLQPSTPEAAAAVHSVFTGTVMRLLHSQEDAGVLQSCCHYLRCIHRRLTAAFDSCMFLTMPRSRTPVAVISAGC